MLLDTSIKSTWRYNMKLSKAMNVLIVIFICINLVIQLIALISLTKTKIGKTIRRAILKGSCTYMDDAIDITQAKMPEWEEKLG